jgi:hypothetical protein
MDLQQALLDDGHEQPWLEYANYERAFLAHVQGGDKRSNSFVEHSKGTAFRSASVGSDEGESTAQESVQIPEGVISLESWRENVHDHPFLAQHDHEAAWLQHTLHRQALRAAALAHPNEDVSHISQQLTQEGYCLLESASREVAPTAGTASDAHAPKSPAQAAKPPRSFSEPQQPDLAMPSDAGYVDLETGNTGPLLAPSALGLDDHVSATQPSKPAPAAAARRQVHSEYVECIDAEESGAAATKASKRDKVTSLSPAAGGRARIPGLLTRVGSYFRRRNSSDETIARRASSPALVSPPQRSVSVIQESLIRGTLIAVAPCASGAPSPARGSPLLQQGVQRLSSSGDGPDDNIPTVLAGQMRSNTYCTPTRRGKRGGSQSDV